MSEQQLWRRSIDDGFGPVTQFIRFDAETGDGVGWEIYEDGTKSDEVEVGRTVPLGFQKVDAA